MSYISFLPERDFWNTRTSRSFIGVSIVIHCSFRTTAAIFLLCGKQPWKRHFWILGERKGAWGETQTNQSRMLFCFLNPTTLLTCTKRLKMQPEHFTWLLWEESFYTEILSNFPCSNKNAQEELQKTPEESKGNLTAPWMPNCFTSPFGYRIKTT